jgi:hypothetical protein
MFPAEETTLSDMGHRKRADGMSVSLQCLQERMLELVTSHLHPNKATSTRATEFMKTISLVSAGVHNAHSVIRVSMIKI